MSLIPKGPPVLVRHPGTELVFWVSKMGPEPHIQMFSIACTCSNVHKSQTFGHLTSFRCSSPKIVVTDERFTDWSECLLGYTTDCVIKAARQFLKGQKNH